jgi:IclR family mhp operon transcriptional activator
MRSLRPRVKTIEALRRGLEVEDLLLAHGVVSLEDLHRLSGIPKASLLRILGTLEDAGRAQRRLADGRYLGLPRRAPTPELLPDSRWSQAAVPSLMALHQRLPWPSDIAVRDGWRMRVLESNRPLCAIAVNRAVVGFRPDMLESALGRAYLGSCPSEERAQILEGLREQRHPGVRSPARVQAILDDVARLGYGRRDPAHIGPDANTAARFSAIAVPIRSRGTVAGCLSCVWLSDVVDEASVVRDHLERLTEHAYRIGEALAVSSTCPSP